MRVLVEAVVLANALGGLAFAVVRHLTRGKRREREASNAERVAQLEAENEEIDARLERMRDGLRRR